MRSCLRQDRASFAVHLSRRTRSLDTSGNRSCRPLNIGTQLHIAIQTSRDEGVTSRVTRVCPFIFGFFHSSVSHWQRPLAAIGRWSLHTNKGGRQRCSPASSIGESKSFARQAQELHRHEAVQEAHKCKPRAETRSIHFWTLYVAAPLGAPNDKLPWTLAAVEKNLGQIFALAHQQQHKSSPRPHLSTIVASRSSEQFQLFVLSTISEQDPLMPVPASPFEAHRGWYGVLDIALVVMSNGQFSVSQGNPTTGHYHSQGNTCSNSELESPVVSGRTTLRLRRLSPDRTTETSPCSTPRMGQLLGLHPSTSPRQHRGSKKNRRETTC